MVYIRAVSGKDVGWVVFLFIKDLGGGSDWTPENSKMSSWLTTSPLAHRAAFAARDYVCTEKEGGAQQQSDGVRFCVVGKRITLPQVMEKSTFESRAFLFSPSQQGGKGVFITFFSISLELIYKTFQYFIVPADVAIRVCWTVNLGVHLSTVQWPLHAIAQENEKAILLL